VAAGEYIGPWGRLQSFLAIEELAGMLPLHEAIPAAAQGLGKTTFVLWKRGLTLELARLAEALHARCCFHKDLYLCHFYIDEQDTRVLPAAWTGRVYVIDLHRLARHPLTWGWWQVKDLAQLLYSSDVAGVTARDRLRFWRAYLGSRRRQWFGEFLRRAVLLRWRRYQRHNAARKARKAALVPVSGEGRANGRGHER
jgi:heptose I phosphotransferase